MTKSDCIQCGGTAQYRFRALEIHTLHIREFKEKRVQALGESVHFDVCADCARAQLQKDLSGVGIKDILPFALILLFGIVLSAVFWNGEGVFRLCGAAGVICGILGIAKIGSGAISIIVFRKKKRSKRLPGRSPCVAQIISAAITTSPISPSRRTR